MIKKLLLFVALLVTSGFAQVTTGIMPIVHQQFLDSTGAPLAGGFVYCYSAGTTVQHACYRDALGTLNSNPVTLDSGGYGDIWLDNTFYKICVANSLNVQQYCKDNITATPATAGLSYAQLAAGNTFLGIQIIGPQNTAISTNNYNSYAFKIRGSYWTGSAAGNDDWQIQNVLGTGANPSSTLTFTHSGSSGTPTFAVPSLQINGGNIMSNPPTFTFTCYKSAASGAAATADCDWNPPFPVKVVRFQVGNVTAPSGCSTVPQYGIVLVSGPTTLVALNLPNGSVNADSGAIAVNLGAAGSAPAGPTYQIGQTQADSGCGAHAGPGNLTVSYQMQ